jgi:hypothetical protein
VKRYDPMVEARVMNQLQKRKSGQTTEQLQNTLKTSQAKILIVLELYKEEGHVTKSENGVWTLVREKRHMKAQPATEETIQTTPSKCTSGPHCPCDFCARLRAKIAGGHSEKDKENQLAEDFLRSYLQTKPAGKKSSR